MHKVHYSCRTVEVEVTVLVLVQLANDSEAITNDSQGCRQAQYINMYIVH